jgi:hypothetical protein
MSNFLHHFVLRAKAKTGFGPAPVGWSIAALVSLIFAAAFLSVAAFIALANRFDGVIAGLILGAVLLAIAGISALAAYFTQRRNRERAERELAAQSRAGMFDPAMLNVAMEIGRVVGWRRIATLAAAGVLAAGLGREWAARGAKQKNSESK